MIDANAVNKVAGLARLQLTDEEKKLYAAQLSAILGYFEQIAKIDTKNVLPLVTPTDVEAFWREDELEKSAGADVAMANAPEKSGNLFKVPPVV